MNDLDTVFDDVLPPDHRSGVVSVVGRPNVGVDRTSAMFAGLASIVSASIAPAFDTIAAHRIGSSAIQPLGYQKQRNTTTSGGCPGQSSQHQMQDVLGQVMFASGNEQLAAAQPITAVVLRFGAAAQQADVAAGLGFGQTHGRQRFATDDLRQITLLDPLRRMGLEAQVSAMGDPRVHGPGVVAGV